MEISKGTLLHFSDKRLFLFYINIFKLSETLILMHNQSQNCHLKILNLRGSEGKRFNAISL